MKKDFNGKVRLALDVIYAVSGSLLSFQNKTFLSY